jgi:hypothetical protein
MTHPTAKNEVAQISDAALSNVDLFISYSLHLLNGWLSLEGSCQRHW